MGNLESSEQSVPQKNELYREQEMAMKCPDELNAHSTNPQTFLPNEELETRSHVSQMIEEIESHVADFKQEHTEKLEEDEESEQHTDEVFDQALMRVAVRESFVNQYSMVSEEDWENMERNEGAAVAFEEGYKLGIAAAGQLVQASVDVVNTSPEIQREIEGEIEIEERQLNEFVENSQEKRETKAEKELTINLPESTTISSTSKENFMKRVC